MDKDLESNQKRVDRLSEDNATLKAKNKQLEKENANLEQGLREIRDAIKEHGTVISFPFHSFISQKKVILKTAISTYKINKVAKCRHVIQL